MQEKSRLEQMVSNLQAQGAAVLGEKKERDADVATLAAAADTQHSEIARLKVCLLCVAGSPLGLRSRPGQPTLLTHTSPLAGVQVELREATASKEVLTVQAAALAAKLAAATQVASEDEAEIRRMATAQGEAVELQGSLEQKLRNVTERASAAELAAADLKAQLAKARVEVEAKEAQVAVRGVAWRRGRVATALISRMQHVYPDQQIHPGHGDPALCRRCCWCWRTARSG